MIRKKKTASKKRRIVVGVFIAVVALAVGTFFFVGLGNEAEVTTTPSTTQEEDQVATKQGESQKNAGAVTTPDNDKQANGAAGSDSVAAPEGNFVSSHRANMGSTIESVCTTTRGASCDISFTKGGVTKTLGRKDVNSAGAASWIWTPASIGLTPGSWVITATAELSGAQTSSKDPSNFEVGS